MKSLALFILCVAAASACSRATSSFRPTTPAPGELVWAFDGELEVTRGGEVVSEYGWSGLADAVSCVPRARALASRARSRRVKGLWIGIAGGLAGLATIGGGTYLALEDDLTTGLATIGGGTVLFATSAIVGGLLVGHANPDALDAVNIYNDEHSRTVGCANPARSAAR